MIGMLEHRESTSCIRLSWGTRLWGYASATWLVFCLPGLLCGEETKGGDFNNRPNGERIYRESCADCHGDQGQGAEDLYEKPLVGDSSIVELAQLIERTMPEGDAESCVGDEAGAVASYIYEKFYGPKAQLAKNPPKKRLARLTGRQLEQSLADLYTRFHNGRHVTDKRGLHGIYFNRDRKKDGDVRFERDDDVVDFDFGTEGPGQGIKGDNFEIVWTGSIRPDQTGRYEIVVESGCSFILHFGATDREFINNYVQSGDKTEFRKSIRLVAGRVYPIKLELTHRRRKNETPPADIKLSWKTPRGVEQVIPRRSLLNLYMQPTFILQTKLPPDDRSYGYERGIAVDRQWNEATTRCAIEFADQVIAELWPWYVRKNKRQPNENRELVKQFLDDLLETAFRGPLEEPLRDRYLVRHLAEVEDDAELIKRVLLLALKSPRFLFPTLDSHQSESIQAANRLALTLHDSLPVSENLRKAARQGKLSSEAQIRDMAWALQNDWRTRAKMQAFLHTWLNWGHIEHLSKSEERHPEFDEELVQDLEASLHQFMEEVTWSDESDYRKLLLADWSITSAPIARFYGPEWTSDQLGSTMRFVRTDGAAEEQSRSKYGVLTHPLLMSGMAYDDASSPIHRGVFLLRFALGRTLNPPNEAFTPFSPDLHPNLTTRERTQLQTGERSCQVCHQKINNLGFALENFDAVGRYRDQELGRAINAEGRYTTRSGEVRDFDGVGDLASFLANHEDAHRAFVRRAFQYFVKQPPAAYGLETEDWLVSRFRSHNHSMRSLLIDIAVIASRPTTDGT